MREKFYEFLEQLKNDSETQARYKNIILIAVLSASALITLSNTVRIYTQEERGGSLTDRAGVSAAIPKELSEVYDNYKYFISYKEAAEEAPERLVFSPVALPDMSSDDGSLDSVIEETVPSVEIKALIVQEGKALCTLDISCEEPMTVYKVGSVFGSGSGRIAAIDLNGVTWTWRGASYRTSR